MVESALLREEIQVPEHTVVAYDDFLQPAGMDTGTDVGGVDIACDLEPGRAAEPAQGGQMLDGVNGEVEALLREMGDDLLGVPPGVEPVVSPRRVGPVRTAPGGTGSGRGQGWPRPCR